MHHSAAGVVMSADSKRAARLGFHVSKWLAVLHAVCGAVCTAGWSQAHVIMHTLFTSHQRSFAIAYASACAACCLYISS